MTFYDVFRAIVVGVCRVAFRVRLRGKEKVPTSGAFVIAPTHRSILDIPFAALVTRRHMTFLAKKELFEKAWMRKLFLSLGGVPVDRGEADRKAVRECADALVAGRPIMVFPEGTRHHGPDIKELFHGTAWLALRAGVPIVPVGIAGSEEILSKGKVIPKFKRVAVVVGDPITVPPNPDGERPQRAAVAATTAQVHTALQAAFDEARSMLSR
ncbi:MAG: lysophospholipid acyltransferase family protein [Acidimicrobiia bacterium]